MLIDECLPWKLGRLLTGHDCVGVVKAGFAGKSNGDLLRSAEAAGFDVLITNDQNLVYQQNLRALQIAVIGISAESNKLEYLRPYVPALLKALRKVNPGQAIKLD